MRVVSFGTEGKFEEYIERLRKSLEEHEIPHQVELIPFPANKFDAALKKPRFILERLDETLLWLDADSYVTGPITLPEGDWDAGFLNHWGTKDSVVCCVVAFRPTDRARAFLEQWAELCERKHRTFAGTEHDRMLVTLRSFSLNEIELTEYLTGKLIVNYGIRKEHFV